MMQNLFRYCRMYPHTYLDLLNRITLLITHQGPRTSVQPGERLAITLKFLASGDSQQTIATSYRMGRSTVCNIISETVTAIF